MSEWQQHYLFLVFLLPAAAPKKLDIDFIPFLSTLDNDFCAAVNFVLICNKTKNTKKMEWKDMTRVRIFLYEMLFIKEVRPSFDTQSDFISAKLFV